MRPLILISLVLIFSVGCNQSNPESKQTREPIGIEQTSSQDEHTLTNEQISTHLATVASEVPNVSDAAAIVAGPYAVVAIDIDKNTKREQVGTIKFSVTEALQHDPYGRTAVIIADADMMTRIRQMGNQLQSGQPVQGIVDELANIVSRYMPMFPVEDIKKDQTGPNVDNEGKSPENEVEQENLPNQ